jgi:hypothetical protein
VRQLRVCELVVSVKDKQREAKHDVPKLSVGMREWVNAPNGHFHRTTIRVRQVSAKLLSRRSQLSGLWACLSVRPVFGFCSILFSGKKLITRRNDGKICFCPVLF